MTRLFCDSAQATKTPPLLKGLLDSRISVVSRELNWTFLPVRLPGNGDIASVDLTPNRMFGLGVWVQLLVWVDHDS